jgi:hypothetical protein
MVGLHGRYPWRLAERHAGSGRDRGATAAAMYGVGQLTMPTPTPLEVPVPGGPAVSFQPPISFDTPLELAENVAGHAAVGCVSAAASGSGCGPGALSAGVSALAGPIVNNRGFAFGLAASSVLGGLASVAGGGKVANGARTAAFGYLFNSCFHGDTCFPEPMSGIDLNDPEEVRTALVTGTVVIGASGAVACVALSGPAIAALSVTGAAAPVLDGLIVANVAGYEIVGAVSVEGTTYTLTVASIQATESAEGLAALASSLRAGAAASGAEELVIEGLAIVNQGLLNPATAARFGFTLERIGEASVRLRSPVQ